MACVLATVQRWRMWRRWPGTPRRWTVRWVLVAATAAGVGVGGQMCPVGEVCVWGGGGILSLS